MEPMFLTSVLHASQSKLEVENIGLEMVNVQNDSVTLYYS